MDVRAATSPRRQKHCALPRNFESSGACRSRATLFQDRNLRRSASGQKTTTAARFHHPIARKWIAGPVPGLITPSGSKANDSSALEARGTRLFSPVFSLRPMRFRCPCLPLMRWRRNRFCPGEDRRPRECPGHPNRPLSSSATKSSRNAASRTNDIRGYLEAHTKNGSPRKESAKRPNCIPARGSDRNESVFRTGCYYHHFFFITASDRPGTLSGRRKSRLLRYVDDPAWHGLVRLSRAHARPDLVIDTPIS